MPRSKCIANAYTNNHDLLASGDICVLDTSFYHAADAVGIVHSIFYTFKLWSTLCRCWYSSDTKSAGEIIPIWFSPSLLAGVYEKGTPKTAGADS
jgi:hypothetical protein